MTIKIKGRAWSEAEIRIRIAELEGKVIELLQDNDYLRKQVKYLEGK